MKKIKYILVLFIILMVAPSCQKLLEENPKDRFVVDNFYKSDKDAEAAVNAIYNRLYNGMYERIFGLVTDLLTDDYKNGGGMSNSQLQDIEYCRATSENAFVAKIWSQSYDGIARANTAIDQIPDINMDEQLKNRFIGEAKFLRALFYFNLVRLFGDVPIILHLGSVEDSYIPRSPKDDVYAQIIADLQDAISYLPPVYSDKDIGRATQGAAKILLGKVYLTLQNWQDAVDVLEDVVNNEATYNYALQDNYGDNFKVATENGPEMVFSVQFQAPPGNGNQMMQGIAPKYSIPGGLPGLKQAWEADIPTLDVYSVFDSLDERKNATFHTEFVSPKNGKTYTSRIPLFYKYYEEGIQKCSESGINYPVLRYSDALLMLAEALNELGRTGEAEPLLNRVRERAFNNTDHDYHGLSQSEFRDSVHFERRLEFVDEGHRLFDLYRWGTFVDVMKAHGHLEAVLTGEEIKNDISNNVSDRNLLYPIPQHEIDLNHELVQNPGY